MSTSSVNQEGVQLDIEVSEAEALKSAYLLALQTLIKKTVDEDWNNSYLR